MKINDDSEKTSKKIFSYLYVSIINLVSTGFRLNYNNVTTFMACGVVFHKVLDLVILPC